MGKKPRGAALRSKKRQQEHLEQLQEQQAEQVAAAAVVDRPDEELFVLDTEGTIVPHHERPPRPETSRKHGARTLRVLTVKEKKEVERLLQTHSRRELVRMVREGRALLDRKHVHGRGARSDKTQKANYDLWGDDDGGTDDDNHKKTDNRDDAAAAAAVSQPRLGSAPAGVSPGHVVPRMGGKRKAVPPPHLRQKVVAVEVAGAGQSYRPDATLHRRALEQAKSIEARRQQAEEYQNTPISQGMSEETKALLVGDSDSEDDESGDDTTTTGTGGSPRRRRRDKLTRAQRNRQKRVRVEKAVQDRERKRRKLENSVAQIPRFKKELRNDDRERRRRRTDLETVRERSRRIKGSNVFTAVSERDPVTAPTYPIGLSSEVVRRATTLRTLKPKGSLVTDRILSLRDRDLAADARGHRKKPRRLKRRKAVRGKHNAGNEGADFAVLG